MFFYITQIRAKSPYLSTEEQKTTFEEEQKTTTFTGEGCSTYAPAATPNVKKSKKYVFDINAFSDF